MGTLQKNHRQNLRVVWLLVLPSLATLAIAGMSQSSHAALVASDNAGNSPYVAGSSFDGQNGGSGFGAWDLLSSGGTSGFLVGSSALNDNGYTPPAGVTGDINTGGQAWEMYAEAYAYAIATRSLTGGALVAGQSISLSFDNGSVASGGSDVFRLLDGSDTLFQFGFTGGALNYSYVDAAANVESTSIPLTYLGLNTVFTLTSATTYSFTITPIGDAQIAPQTISGTINGSITGFDAGDYGAGSGAGANFYINSVAVSNIAAPLPASLGFVLVGGLGLAGMALSRRRSRMQA